MMTRIAHAQIYLSIALNMEFWLHTVLVLAVSAVTVLGLPDGAPMVACTNGLIPGHTSAPNVATGDVPFYVNTSDIGDYYMPEEAYTIVLSGTFANMDFRGFIIQARRVADDSPVGQFMTGTYTDQQVQCDGDTAVTHTSNQEKTMVELTWTAPMEGTGTIVFRYAFVDRYSMADNINIFWAGLETDMIGEDQTNEGNEFFVGFFRNRFGRTDEPEVIPPVLWITTKESMPVNFTVSTFFGLIASGVATPGEITYIDIPLGFVVFNSSVDSETDTRFKGIRIKAEDDRRIIVFGQNEEVSSNDAYLALPIISLPAGRSYEYIAASIFGDSGTVGQSIDSVALIIGTENDTEIILEPSVPITHPFAPMRQFIPGVPVQLRTVTIQRFQTFYLEVRGGDISGTRIIANKPISAFSGHECANVPLASIPCDMLIEQLQPIDTWGTEVVTVPLSTRSGDVLKVFASQDSTIVNVTYTNISSGLITSDSFSFTLNRNGFRELGGTSIVVTGAIADFALIQSNNPIAVFQFSRSFTTDNNIISDPFMLSVPSYEQYRDSYAVAPAPLNETIEGTVPGRVAYVSYTNIAVPAEYFNASLITVNNNPINASEFRPIRRADNSIWGYGAQLLLDEGAAQVIRHQDPNAALSVTIYGFSNQMSWGSIGGTGLAPIALRVPPDIDEGPFIPQPPAVMPGDMTVPIGTPTYIVDGFDVTLVCNIASGTRPITIMWIRNGVTYPAGGNRSTITVPDTDYNDADVFTCRADNIIGFDMENTTINVFEPPQILPIPFPTPRPGETTVSTGQPMNTTITPGTDVTIYCPSSGIDIPSIEWFRNGVMVVVGGRFTISTTTLPGAVITSVLSIDDFQGSDAGTYTCTSTNVVSLADGGTTLLGGLCPDCPPGALETPNPDPDGCPICGVWETDMFGPCSLECHLGVMTRRVFCVNVADNDQPVVPNSFCDTATMPAESQSCGSGSCSTGWRKGPWSKCSRTCQTGHQMRKVVCTDMGVVVPDHECAESQRPKSMRFCNGHIECFPCKDEFFYHCRRLARTRMGCMGDYARKICCWSCRND